jgi:hypothetical protein
MESFTETDFAGRYLLVWTEGRVTEMGLIPPCGYLVKMFKNLAKIKQEIEMKGETISSTEWVPDDD